MRKTLHTKWPHAARLAAVVYALMLSLWPTAMHAQGPAYTAAFIQQTTPVSKSERHRLLRNILTDLEEAYQVDFNYDDDQVGGLTTDRPLEWGRHERLSGILNRIQQAFGVSVERQHERSYLILRQRPASAGHSKDDTASREPAPEAEVAAASQYLAPVLPDVFPVSGIVRDESGGVLPGVNILEKGTSNGVVSNAEGSFSLDVASGDAILVFSFIGYLTKEVAVQGQSKLEVALTPDIQTLSEVVVVGYGEQKKANLTGSVERVEGSELAKRPVMQASMTLQGVAPGVTVTQASGQPGADQGTIRIRGIGTLNNADPLVLIDGVPGNLNTIDPNDIETISVLKDAASSAIYGSRAANGVVLITTKRADKEKLSVQYNAYAGVQVPTDLPEFLGGLDYMRMLNEAYQNQGQDAPFTDEYIDNWITLGPSDRDTYPDTDWQKEVIKQSASQQHHYLTVTGGSEKASVRASLSYMDQDGLIGNTDFQRYSVRINTDLQISDRFDIGFDFSGTQADRSEPNEGMSQVFYQVNRASPLFIARYSDGSFGPGYNFANPLVQSTAAGQNRWRDHQLFLNMRSSFEIAKGLHFKLNFSPTYNFVENKNFARKFDFYDLASGDYLASRPEISSLAVRSERTFNIDFQSLITYERSIGDHFISALVGYNYYDSRYDFVRAYREGFVLPEYEELNAGSAENQRGNGSSDEWALRSVFGRLNYDFKGRYLFEANLRYDGSSRFSRDNRYGVFPSFSAGWRISDEAFLSGVRSLSNLKLRASWGQLGNQNVPGGNYPYQSFIAFGQGIILGNNTLVDGAALLDAANPDLTWETTEMTNFGLDLAVFDNKLDLTADVYNKKTRDIIFAIPIPATTGLNAPPVNAGEVVNRGWELRIGHNNKVNDFQYRIGFNLSDVKTEITDLKDTGPIFPDRFTIWDEGSEFNALYGLVADGYFQSQDEVASAPTQFGTLAPGDIRYKDLNEDGIINAQDRQIIGSTIPRLTFGLDMSAQWKGFDLTIFFQGVGKRDGYLEQEAAWAFYNGGKAQAQHLDYWTEDNPDAAFPRLTYSLTNNQQVSSFWRTNAAYLRLKNVVLGYTLPAAATEKISISRCRIYASGQNLFSIDDYNGFDPESRLGNGNFYPFVSVYTAGIDITF